jgi:hypothetical protein
MAGIQRDDNLIGIEGPSGDVAEVVSRSNSTKGIATNSEIYGRDSLGNFRNIQSIVRPDGITAMPIDGTVTVTSTFGFDQQPDSFFQIINTGAAGNTWTVFIRGTSGDPTSPDRDLPDYTKIFTVQAGEVGYEIALRDRMITELNADSTFRNTVFLKARKATDRAVVHISSDKFSASGEFYERPVAGDFMVTVTGTAQVVLGFDNLISRSKPVTISRDLDSPHRLGLFGVTGAVSITAKELSDLFYAEATHVTYGSNMLQNGSLATPIIFTIAAGATQKFVEHMWFSAQGNGIKWGQFFSKSGAGGLTNGVLVEIKSDNVVTTFPVLKTTEDFKNKWAALSGDGANYRPDFQAGADESLAILRFPNPFLLRESGAFGVGNDDYIKVYIRDNITSGLLRLDFASKGFEKEP